MMMKRQFKIEKLPLETLIDLLINLYESGIDYVDMSSDNDDPAQDKLIIQTRDSYINPNWIGGDRTDKYEKYDSDEEDEDEDDDPLLPKKQPPTIETKRLTDEDLNELL